MLALLKLLAESPIRAGNLPRGVDTSNGSTTIPTLLSVVLGIAGALALTMIVVSGLRYIVSAGNAEKTAKAKNGIIYALVGLVIAISAEAIVAYVGNRI
ncbi:MAG TPA: pilin [Candidatus Saccharimonadales bacterium]